MVVLKLCKVQPEVIVSFCILFFMLFFKVFFRLPKNTTGFTTNCFWEELNELAD